LIPWLLLIGLANSVGGISVQDKTNNEIAQLTFYLCKEKTDFAGVIDPESSLQHNKAFRQHDFTVDSAQCRFIYFEAESAKSNPSWLDFINEQLGTQGPIVFRSKSRNPNGILLILIGNRLLAATFGRTATSCLLKKVFEPDFGIKTAMNLCGNEEIRQTKSQSNAITTTQIDRQVSKPSDAFAFGLSEAEDLKYISAHMKGNKRITLQGRDSLTIKIIGEDKFSWETLIDQCRKFLKAYGSKDYVSLFPNYKNFQAATDAESNALDLVLIKAIKDSKFEKLQLSIPEFLPDDEFSFSYTNNASRENIIHSHLDVQQLELSLKLKTITVEQLHSKMIYAFSPQDNRVLAHRKWSVYDCLVFEHRLGTKFFILSDGRWLEVDSDFYNSIVDFIQNRLHIEQCEAPYFGIEIIDPVALKNREALFNEEVCRRRTSSILFDRAKLRIGKGRKDKEFCDILDLTDDGMVRIIHCKPFKDASSIGYLFSQAKFYCDAFLRDEVLLADIRKYIANSTCSVRDQYLAHIKPTIEEIHGQEYSVCLWLLYDQSKTVPSKNNIPLISQYELKLMHEHLRRTCKFRDVILRFIPVKMSSYKKAVKPKAKAA
jgi:uncharacterized protein (TIGR04141 family)